MRQVRIMVSSTRADLMQYRDAAAQIISKVAQDVEDRYQILDKSMEKQTQTGDREFAVEVSKRWVEDKADWIVLIVGWHYGTISDESEAKGFSVTEWEYRHAMKLKEQKPTRKVFVFVAGEPKSAVPYRVSDEEIDDLKDWMGEQDDRQREQLKRFKAALSQPHTEFFRNLAHFRERLEATLRREIDRLVPPIAPGSNLAGLILAVKPAMQACFGSVKQLSTCKSIHDCLHKLRQNVVRRLREEDLPMWKQEGELSASREGRLNRRALTAMRLLGNIENLALALQGNNQDLRDRIQRVVQTAALWDPEADPKPGFEIVSEKVDDFARDVQDAFTDADNAMLSEQYTLGNLHAFLLQRIGDIRAVRALGMDDDQILNTELDKIDQNKARLIAALHLHHDWQRLHDALERLHTEFGTQAFPKRLNQFIDKDLPKLARLVDTELAAFHAVPASEAHGPAEADLLADLERVKPCIEALLDYRDNKRFAEMQGPFDDVFFRIDTRTLREVDCANERVEGFSRLLDDLAQRNAMQPDQIQREE